MELTAAAIAERTGWIEDLGFANAYAVLLATGRDSDGRLVTVHDIRNALERGMTRAQAVAIFG